MARIALAILCPVADAGAADAKTDGQQNPREHSVMREGADPIYPGPFYASFRPQTALDMLERTPGFVMMEGDMVRGFGGAAGNVLIDGQRPTVKIGGVAEVLRRIPAARVDRITLLRSGGASEAQGQTLVANVVLTANATGSGTATLEIAHTSDGHVSPSGRVSYARAIGLWQTSIELSGEMVRYPSDARYRVRDATGALVQSRAEQAFGKAPELGLAASASLPFLGGTLVMNGRLGYDGYRSHQRVLLHAGDFITPVLARRDIAYDETGYFAELGADWTRPLGNDWTAKLLGIGRIERYRSDEDYAEPGYRGVSALRQQPAEAVVRATISRLGEHPLRPELGTEIVWNGLTSDLDYAKDFGSGLAPVVLSGAHTRVTEVRGEFFANLNARLGGGFDTQTGAAFEVSRIRVTGDVASSRTLSHFKPSAALTWQPTTMNAIRLGLNRTVGQLDFGDFAASVDQSDGRALGGNAKLRPTRVSRAFLRLDHRKGKGGALSAELFQQWHHDLLGYILLPSGEQALGVIGAGRERGLTLQATLPFTAIVSGSQLKLDGTFRRSRVRDPINGRNRDIDELPDSALSVEFRQDMPALKSAWGVRHTTAEVQRIFYVGEEFVSRTHAVWTAYVETTAFAGIKAALTVEGIAGQDDNYLRRFHAPSRTAAFTGDETRDQRQGTVISLTLTRAL